MQKNNYGVNNYYYDELDYAKPLNMVSAKYKELSALKQRKIFLYDNVNKDVIFETIFFLQYIRDIDKRTNSKEPIEILINSNGGDVEDGLSLISLIEQMKNEGYKIITTNMGASYSMGFLISICGSERQAWTYSDYMVHDVSNVVFGKLESIKENLQFTESLRNRIFKIIDKYTKIPKNKLMEVIDRKQDWFITPEDMLKYKGIERII